MRLRPGHITLALLTGFLLTTPCVTVQAVVLTNLASLTATDLAQMIMGTDVTVLNAAFTGTNVAAGTFSEGRADDLDIDAGVILCSGHIGNAVGPNESDNRSTINSEPGDADLDLLIPDQTRDAAVLEFDFVCPAGQAAFRYVFASEEYNEYAQLYGDVCAIYLDGTNIALVPGSSSPMTITSVNLTTNAHLYRNNDPGDLGVPTPCLTQYDGFTRVLSAQPGVVSGATHHVKFAIADAYDRSLDSALFIAPAQFRFADLALTKDDLADPADMGAVMQYYLLVSNAGPHSASNVVVSDSLPPSAAGLDGATLSQGSADENGGVVTWNIGVIEAGATAYACLEVIHTTNGVVTNTAGVTCSDFDPNPANDTASEQTTIRAFTLQVSGSPAVHGTSAPYGYGTHTFAPSTIITNRISTPADESGGTRYVCGGWSGSGGVPASGTGTSVTFTISQDSTLTWLWSPQYMLTLTGAHGMAEGTTSGWKDEGRLFELYPHADTDYVFDHWNLDGIGAGNAPFLAVTADNPHVVSAVCVSSNWSVTATGTLALASWRYTNNWFWIHVQLCNEPNSGVRMQDLFIVALRPHDARFLPYPHGTNRYGEIFWYATPLMQAALTNTGNGDTVMDPGECVVIGEIAVSKVIPLPLQGHLYAQSVPDTSTRDADRDGMPNGWEDDHSLDPSDAGDGSSDTDSDHVPAVREYGADTDPNDGTSYLRIESMSHLPLGMQVEWAGGIQATQYLEGAITLAGPWYLLHSNVPPTAVTSICDHVYEGPRTVIYRIRAGR